MTFHRFDIVTGECKTYHRPYRNPAELAISVKENSLNGNVR